MNIVRLSGGLGNQLFQVTAAFYIRQTTGSRVWCDTSWFDVRRHFGRLSRVFEVERCLRDEEILRVPMTLARGLFRQRGRGLARWPVALYEHDLSDDLIERRPRWPTVLDGFFQKAAYPIAMQDELRNRLHHVLDDEPSDAIALHARLGDYFHTEFGRGTLGLSDPSYFAKALDQARGAVGTLPVRVYTDSPDLVREYLGGVLPPDTEVATTPDPWTALQEMSRCRALVMSNSTLSWWAAFVGNVLARREMFVAMPTPWWAAPTRKDENLLAPGWHPITREIVP